MMLIFLVYPRPQGDSFICPPPSGHARTPQSQNCLKAKCCQLENIFLKPQKEFQELCIVIQTTGYIYALHTIGANIDMFWAMKRVTDQPARKKRKEKRIIKKKISEVPCGGNFMHSHVCPPKFPSSGNPHFTPDLELFDSMHLLLFRDCKVCTGPDFHVNTK